MLLKNPTGNPFREASRHFLSLQKLYDFLQAGFLPAVHHGREISEHGQLFFISYVVCPELFFNLQNFALKLSIAFVFKLSQNLLPVVSSRFNAQLTGLYPLPFYHLIP